MPEISLKSEAMRMEKVSVICTNINSADEAIVDFGDGSELTTIKGPFKLIHQYSKASSNMPGGVYEVRVTVGGKTISRPITIHPLLALSALVKDVSAPNYRKVLLMAHRSNTTDLSLPENSIAALQACIQAGVDFVETDTHITSDGHVVISHDQTVDRTTNGKGDITQMTLAEIKSYRLKDRRGILTDMTIPTLEEFLTEAKGKIYVNLDYSPRTASTFEVMSVVRKLDMMDQTLFYCNSTSKIKEVLSREPSAHPYPWHSNYSALPGPGYFVQCSYKPNTTPEDLSASIKAGMIVTVNMLNGGNVNELLSGYPKVRVIQSDISDQLDDTLSLKGLR